MEMTAILSGAAASFNPSARSASISAFRWINLSMRAFVHLLLPLSALFMFPSQSRAEGNRPPNVILIFADDLGYGDLGCYGGAGGLTPNLDRLAAEGCKFTNFHVSQPVCSASRASLMTGCYANRIGIHGALFPDAKNGLPAEETTMAEMFRAKGYKTAAIGKWHLGSQPAYLPTRQGFDEYLGLPYSNDMWPHVADYLDHKSGKPSGRKNLPALPLIENESVIDPDVDSEDQRKLTQRYTARALSFIERNRNQPFFLYLAHTMPHIPLFPGRDFEGRSKRGMYGDVVMEIDNSVGKILASLDRLQLTRDTLVIFSSDNGPWLCFGEHGGSAGPLREGKSTCWEGGTRVPCVMRWPGKIDGGRTSPSMMMTIDLLPSLASMIGAPLPPRPIDGKDVSALLMGKPGATHPHDAYYFYFRVNELHAVTQGDGSWKLVLPHSYPSLAGAPGGKGGRSAAMKTIKVEKPELYHLETDLSETRNVADAHPEKVAWLLARAEKARQDLGDRLVGRKGTGMRSEFQKEPAENSKSK